MTGDIAGMTTHLRVPSNAYRHRQQHAADETGHESDRETKSLNGTVRLQDSVLRERERAKSRAKPLVFASRYEIAVVALEAGVALDFVQRGGENAGDQDADQRQCRQQGRTPRKLHY